MERWDVAEQLLRLRFARRCYALVVLVAVIGFAVSLGAYYGAADPIATASADERP
jgi:hypothetical protein